MAPSVEAATNCQLFEVVGGASKGGLIVRTGKDVSSPEAPGRLATGAIVRSVEHDAEADRMLFEKVTGKGPLTGWVSTVFKGKELLVKTDKEVTASELEEQEAEDSQDLAMQLYCHRFGHTEDDADHPGQNRKAFRWNRDGNFVSPQACNDLQRDLTLAEIPKDLQAVKTAGLVLCSHCQLPVGDTAYAAKEAAHEVTHGECLAEIMLLNIQKEDKAREQKELALKRERREEFDIGWKAEHIPSSVSIAAKLEGCSVLRGMCCLVFQPDGTISIAPTVEPAAAVNLEFLATALQVRRRDSREPLFSLDPVDPASPKLSMQMKRFEPAWLAGTSVGEVLFQSDYHLKELSMGEYEQPVLGMKSCHDYSAQEEQDRWSAREWYVVRKAEVQVSEDSVLIPFVKMGIEAREQVLGNGGLEDVKATRPDHPAVKYAESFTHNFDLIAERKSVVFHLRELAKASIMAKYLVETEASLDRAWFSAVEEPEEATCLEIPQLWNDRCHSQILVQDGKIVNADAELDSSMHRMYGGVQFGLDKFQLSGGRQPARMMSAGLAARQFVQPARHLSSTLSAGLATRQFQRSFGPMGVQPARVSAGVGLDKFALAGTRQPARMMSAGLAARQFVQPARHLSATLSAGLATRQFQRSFGPMGVQPARVSAGVARGVDLNLDEFNLSEATQVTRQGASLKVATGVDITSSFWSNLDADANSMFTKDDKSLLRAVFNSRLSDRRDEGNRFVPPDTSLAYIQDLRTLVEQEEAVRHQREQNFCSSSFDMESPGLQFPSSWQSSVEISRRETSGKQGNRVLYSRPDFKSQALLEQDLEKAVPVFEKSTEDGTRFRIYRFGSLEVRTTQPHEGKEAVGAVFSISSSVAAFRQHSSVAGNEKVMKVTEYVEGCGAGHHHCYVLLETEKKNVIVAEELRNGGVKRDENPKDLEDRNSLAKVLRTADVSKSGIAVADVKCHPREMFIRLSSSQR